MATAPCVVRVHRSAETLLVQVDGWGTMVQSLPLRRFVEQAVADGITRLRLDLGSCQYLDSTFLGTLFLLKRLLQRRAGAVSLDALSPDCKKLLEQMGVENLFPVTSHAAPPLCDWLELEGCGAEVQALHRNVVQAHQELAGMEGKCGEMFRPVAQCLARDLDQTKDS